MENLGLPRLRERLLLPLLQNIVRRLRRMSQRQIQTFRHTLCADRRIT